MTGDRPTSGGTFIRNRSSCTSISISPDSLEYVLIGATAMGFHGVIRATEHTVRAKDHEDAAALRERFDLTDEEK